MSSITVGSFSLIHSILSLLLNCFPAIKPWSVVLKLLDISALTVDAIFCWGIHLVVWHLLVIIASSLYIHSDPSSLLIGQQQVINIQIMICDMKTGKWQVAVHASFKLICTLIFFVPTFQQWHLGWLPHSSASYAIVVIILCNFFLINNILFFCSKALIVYTVI